MKLADYRGFQISWYYDDPMYTSIVAIVVEQNGETVFESSKLHEQYFDNQEDKIIDEVKKEIDEYIEKNHE